MAGNPDGGTTAHTSPMDPLGLYGLNHAVPGLAGTIGSNTFAGGNHPIGGTGGAGGGGAGGAMGGKSYHINFMNGDILTFILYCYSKLYFGY